VKHPIPALRHRQAQLFAFRREAKANGQGGAGKDYLFKRHFPAYSNRLYHDIALATSRSLVV